VQHEWCSECLGELAGLRVVEIGTYVRQVGAMVGAGVEIDTDIAPPDDLRHEQIGDPCGE